MLNEIGYKQINLRRNVIGNTSSGNGSTGVVAPEQTNDLFTCNYVTLENYDLSGTETIDGESPTNGDLILVTAQTDPIENGVYTYKNSGAWTRKTGVVGGGMISITGGTKQGTIWVVENPVVDEGVSPIDIVELALNRKAGDFATFGSVTIADSDISLLEDASDSGNKKKWSFSDLKTYLNGFFLKRTASDFTTFTSATPTASDVLLIEDESDSNSKKKTTIQGILDLVPSGGGTAENILINSNFQVWQRFSRVLNITTRARSSNFAYLRVGAALTDVIHRYLDYDVLQIYDMSDTSYNNDYAEINKQGVSAFSYANVGANQGTTTETTGKCVLISNESIVCENPGFFADRWYSIRDTGYSGARPYTDGVEIDSSTPSKFAIVQIVTAKEVKEHYGKQLSFSIDVSSTVSSKVTVALLGWFGATDVPNKDIVSSWNLDGVDPTLTTDWSYLGTSTPVDITTLIQTVTLEDIGIGSAKNIAVIVWFDTYSGYNRKFRFRNSQLIESETIQPYKKESYVNELTNCLRFYQKSYNIEDPPFKKEAIGKHVFNATFGVGTAGFFGTIPLAQMYKTPNITLISPATSKEGKWQDETGTEVSVIGDLTSQNSVAIGNDGVSTITAEYVSGHYVAESEI